MRKKIFFIVFAIVLLTLIIFPVSIFRSLNNSVSDEQEQIEFVIKDGESLIEISTNLKNSGLITDRLPFLIYFKVSLCIFAYFTGFFCFIVMIRFGMS